MTPTQKKKLDYVSFIADSLAIAWALLFIAVVLLAPFAGIALFIHWCVS